MQRTPSKKNPTLRWSSPEELAQRLRDRVAALPLRNIPALRSVRREFSREIAGQDAHAVIRIALCILEEPTNTMRFLAYELVSQHRGAFESFTPGHLPELGRGLGSWAAVDCFACYLSGPSWLQGRVSDSLLEEWAHHEDRWQRRAALVSTVALARHGTPVDLDRMDKIDAPQPAGGSRDPGSRD